MGGGDGDGKKGGGGGAGGMGAQAGWGPGCGVGAQGGGEVLSGERSTGRKEGEREGRKRAEAYRGPGSRGAGWLNGTELLVSYPPLLYGSLTSLLSVLPPSLSLFSALSLSL